jgi:hypothetical protein
MNWGILFKILIVLLNCGVECRKVDIGGIEMRIRR